VGVFVCVGMCVCLGCVCVWYMCGVVYVRGVRVCVFVVCVFGVGMCVLCVWCVLWCGVCVWVCEILVHVCYFVCLCGV